MPTTARTKTEEENLLESLDQFSLGVGGPLYRFYLRHRLATPDLAWVRRRTLFFMALTWLPLLALSLWQGDFLGTATNLPFLYDIEAHVRFLIVVPLFLAGENAIHKRLKHLILQFVERGIVRPGQYAELNRIVGSAVHWRNSAAVEVILALAVFTVGRLFWMHELDLKVLTWYGLLTDSGQALKPAGYWYAFIAIPVFQFLVLRSLHRAFIWACLLWQISRLDLHILPTHPDRAGGLGFLADVVDALRPLLFALGALLAAGIADRIFFGGMELLDCKRDILIVLCFLMAMVLGPLCFFTPLLIETKVRGNLVYGALASRYADEFDRKWARREACPDEALVGSADIQSLADMGASFEVVDSMRMTPFGKEAVLLLLAISGAPLLPLTLTMFSAQEMLKRLVEALL